MGQRIAEGKGEEYLQAWIIQLFKSRLSLPSRSNIDGHKSELYPEEIQLQQTMALPGAYEIQ